MVGDTAPEWVKQWQRIAINGGNFHCKLRNAREKVRQIRRTAEAVMGSPSDDSGTVQPQKIADIIAFSSAASGKLTQAAADWLDDMHLNIEAILMRLPHLLSIVSKCERCMGEIQGANLHNLAADSDEARAVENFLHWINRFPAGAERRRILLMWDAVNENGVATALLVGINGEAKQEQDGLDAYRRKKERAA